MDDMLEGYVAVNPGVRLLHGHRIVVRADVEDYAKSGKVAVLSGGGSGHEPSQTGKNKRKQVYYSKLAKEHPYLEGSMLQLPPVMTD